MCNNDVHLAMYIKSESVEANPVVEPSATIEAVVSGIRLNGLAKEFWWSFRRHVEALGGSLAS